VQPSREKALWACVLGQAINDALGRASYNPKEYRRDGGTYDPHLEARQWIEQGGPDFQAVCHAAGLDPDAVRDAVLAGRVGPPHLATDRPRRRIARTEGRAA
jgi:hypothetical protein